MSEVVVFGSPTSVGHVRPLMPLAQRLVERGYTVIWAISGDPDEPASAWTEPMAKLGVHFIDVDQHARFERKVTDASISVNGLRRRVVARANDVAAAATAALRTAIDGRRVIAGVLDFFGLWSYVAMKNLGIARIHILVSAFPTFDGTLNNAVDDPIYDAELAKLRATGSIDKLRFGLMPDDPNAKVFAATSRHLCPHADAGVALLGVPREALPSTSSIPPEHAPLIERLRAARSNGTRVVLLSMGSLVMKFGPRINPAFPAFIRQLYSTLTEAALRANALVIASTTSSSADALGLAHHDDRVIPMTFVPQPLLFAHGLVDVMLMHGGANTFHETALSAIPSIVCPVMGDQESVARAVMATGIGVAVESLTVPNLPGAQPLERIANETLPAMLAPANAWKREATRIAAQLASEDGIAAEVALVLGT